MIKQQRRVFLQVIAGAPLVACAGADPEGSPAGSFGGSQANAGGGAGGKPFGAGGNATGGAGGNPLVNGGAGSGGSPSTAGGGSGGTAAGGAGVGGSGGGTTKGMAIGNVSSYPLGSFSIGGGIFFIGHDAGGLYAMSMQCTHRFCACDIVGNQLSCPCHGSLFDRSGNVVRGPAGAPLPHYAVYVDAAGNVSVDRFTIVGMSARTPV